MTAEKKQRNQKWHDLYFSGELDMVQIANKYKVKKPTVHKAIYRVKNRQNTKNTLQYKDIYRLAVIHIFDDLTLAVKSIGCIMYLIDWVSQKIY